MTNPPIVFFDTETDGLHHNRRAWEIAMIRRDDHGERETSFFVDIDLSRAELKGLSIGGYYERHPTGRYQAGTEEHPPRGRDDLVYEGTAALTVARWTHGAHIVGAVPNFDTETLAPVLRRHGLRSAWHFHLIDIEAMAIGYLAAVKALNPLAIDPDFDPTALPWKSDELSRACGVEPPTEEERHTAMGDARWAMRWYDAITGGAR